MTRFSLALLAATASAGLAAAGSMPTPTWGYKVYTPFGPTPIISFDNGLTPTDAVLIPAADIAAALESKGGEPLPDPATYLGDRYQQVIESGLGVMFISEQQGLEPGYYRDLNRTFDTVGWRVTRDWTKLDTADGPVWELVEETYDGYGPGYGDNYAGRETFGGTSWAWDRYNVRTLDDGSIAMNMVPNVPSNPRHVPEPGTLALAGVGAVGLLGAWLKRRQKAATV